MRYCNKATTAHMRPTSISFVGCFWPLEEDALADFAVGGGHECCGRLHETPHRYACSRVDGECAG